MIYDIKYVHLNVTIQLNVLFKETHRKDVKQIKILHKIMIEELASIMM